MRQGRQRRDLPDGTREHHLSRGAEDGGQALRHRGQGEGDDRGGGATQRRPRVDVRPERLGCGVLRQLPPPRDRRAERGPGLFPSEARHDRRHDPEIRTGILSGEGRPDVEGRPGGGLQTGVSRLDGAFAATRERRVALRPLPRPCDLPRAQHFGAHRGVRRPHAAHRQAGGQVPELPRERDIQ